jgi:hypothetical protein
MPDTNGLGGNTELTGDFGLADAGGEQLGRLEPAGLKPLAFSLCRGAARDSWHAGILPGQAARRQLSPTALNPTPKAL